MTGSGSARIAELVGDKPGGSTKLAFVSDLHLFNSRCDYERHEVAIRYAIEQSDVCVWGGDLFDFHWSCAGDALVSQKLAIAWLDNWRAQFPDKTFVYLMGNHDAQPSFQSALEAWAAAESRGPVAKHPLPSQTGQIAETPPPAQVLSASKGAIHVGLDAIRIGDCVLTHGDVIEPFKGRFSRPVTLASYRERWQHERMGNTRPPMVRNQLYDAAVTARLHLVAAGVAHRHHSVCMRLLRWVEEQPSWFGADVQRVVFGHTHRRLEGAQIAGAQFYNGGATVRHVRFSPVSLVV
ncbi:metallophosphoesterase [Neorhodopirellula lusitana]|uniref:metallophosphoesterase n=1 Tax=Neorhodopirellula lusitana TaxID=445327 RepID=UPI00384CAEC9